MISASLVQLTDRIRAELAVRGPMTCAGLCAAMPSETQPDVAAAMRKLRHGDHIRRCALGLKGEAVWALADRPTPAGCCHKLSPTSVRVACRHKDVPDIMTRTVPADRYGYATKRQRQLAEQYGVGLVYVHDRTGDRLPQYVERQARAAGWRAVRLGSVLRDSGARQATVWGLIRMPVYAGGLE